MTPAHDWLRNSRSKKIPLLLETSDKRIKPLKEVSWKNTCSIVKPANAPHRANKHLLTQRSLLFCFMHEFAFLPWPCECLVGGSSRVSVNVTTLRAASCSDCTAVCNKRPWELHCVCCCAAKRQQHHRSHVNIVLKLLGWDQAKQQTNLPDQLQVMSFCCWPLKWHSISDKYTQQYLLPLCREGTYST